MTVREPPAAPVPSPARARDSAWMRFLRWVDQHADGTWIFRGHSSRAFQLQPSAGRVKEGTTAAQVLTREKQIFSQFKRQARLHIQYSASFNLWEWMTLAQHYGVPTRLLDWTSNPLVAAYFAVASPPEDRPARIVAVRLLAAPFVDVDTDHPFELDGVRFFDAPAVAPRVASQSGLFSVHPQPHEPWAVPTTLLDSFDISAPLKAEFRNRLCGMGIHAASIWGDLPGLGEHLRWHLSSGHPFPADGAGTIIQVPDAGAAQTGSAV
jgi:FRG domain